LDDLLDLVEMKAEPPRLTHEGKDGQPEGVADD
jgi:hypothetical protein